MSLQIETVGEYYAGFLSPVVSLTLLLLILGFSLLAGKSEPRIARWVLLAFPLGVLAGHSLPLDPTAIRFALTFNRAAILIIGVLIVIRGPQPFSLLLLMATIFGVSLGYENATYFDKEYQSLIYCVGLLSGVIFGLAIFCAFAVWMNKHWHKIVFQALGLALTAYGLILISSEYRA